MTVLLSLFLSFTVRYFANAKRHRFHSLLLNYHMRKIVDVLGYWNRKWVCTAEQGGEVFLQEILPFVS